MYFFTKRFLNARGILAQSTICTLIFVNFLTLYIGDNSNNQASSVSWLPVNPNLLESLFLEKKH